jgi:hypothetical protein
MRSLAESIPAQPLSLDLDAVLERILQLGLGFEILGFAFQESGVGTFDAQQAIGIDAVQLHDLGGNIFEEVAVVADQDAGEGGGGQGLFEPGDAGEVEMVGGLVQQQDVGAGHHGLGDGEALAPASAEGRGLGGDVGEADASAGFAQTAFALRFRHAAGFEGAFEHVTDGHAGREGRLLAHIADARTLSGGDVAGVGVFFSGEHSEQRRLAGAVGTDQADAVAVRDDERDFVEQRHRTEPLRNTLRIQNRRHKPV